MAQSSEHQRRGEKSAAKTALKLHGRASRYDTPVDQRVERLNGESDRGVLVLIGSLVEEALETALSESLPGATRSDYQALFGFNGPIGTFASKALFAKALGLISEQAWELIEIIRSLRNSAAHYQQTISFATPSIAAAVNSLVSESTRLTMKDDPSLIRDRFILAGALLHIIVLYSITGKTKPEPGLEKLKAFIASHQLVPVTEELRENWVGQN